MTSATVTTPDIASIRARFPSLASGFAYLENAGGSQVPAVVADAIRDYMLSTYVQLGAGYPQSVVATETVERAHAFINEFMNGTAAGKVILGSSSTSLCYTIANAYGETLKPGDEIVVCETGHEANVGPWDRLARFGARIRIWKIDPTTLQCPLEELQKLLNPKTRLVAFPHVSNLLGEIVDVPSITRLVHEAGARVFVDGVAYAPHRPIDVGAWNVDWYVYSTYKVYGPHMGAVYGRADAIAELTGPNHFFIAKEQIPYKFELGGASHEGCAGLLALGRYFNFLLDRHEDTPLPYADIARAMEMMGDLELPLQTRFVDYLKTKPQVKLVGPAHGRSSRVGTISFLHNSLPSNEIAARVNAGGKIGIRSGNAYAYRLCQALGIDVATGVVRASFVHYNTIDEVNRLIEALDQVL